MSVAKRFPKGQRVVHSNSSQRGTVIRRKLDSDRWWIMVLFDGATRAIACVPGLLRRLRRKDTIARMVEDVVKHDPSPEYVASDYYAGSDRPYRLILRHPRTDEPLEKVDALMTAMVIADVKDGDEIRIVVVKTGKRPFGDRRVVLREPHTYVRETEAQRKKRMTSSSDSKGSRACGCCPEQERKGMS